MSKTTVITQAKNWRGRIYLFRCFAACAMRALLYKEQAIIFDTECPKAKDKP